MKKFKLLLFSLVISFGIFTSCTDNNDINNLPDVQESEAVQSVITELRTMYNDDGTVIVTENPTGNMVFDFCFDFVYPITLIYNTGTTVDVNSLEELIAVILNSSNDVYVVGIEFPFNVEVYNAETNQIEIITINNEEEFAQLFESCIIDDSCNCTDEFDPVCVDVEEGGQTITITFPNSCYAECDGFSEDQYYSCDSNNDCDCPDVYEPVCVSTPSGEIIEFDNECYALCEGFTPNDFVDCNNDDGCNCPDVYEPVCVETASGEIIEFDNFCYAECEGFTQADVVNCENDDNECEIEEFSVTIGDCNDDGTYSITINFQYGNTDQTDFNVYLRNDVYLGSYPLASLPVTIDNFELSGYDEDFIKVCIEGANGSGNTDCCHEEEWFPPNCNGGGGDCSISNLEIVVGDCNPSGSYVLTFNFDYENVNGQEYFDLFGENNEFLGYYQLVDLPVTIYNFEPSGNDNDYIRVCINDTEDCCQEIEWTAPNCDPNVLCYEFVFPVSLYLNGTTVEVNSNEDVDYYLDMGYNLVYPIDIIYNNETITVQQGLLEGAYGDRCDD